MAAPVISKLIVKFNAQLTDQANQQRGGVPTGWEEVWWTQTDDDTQAKKIANDYVRVRRDLLGIGASIIQWVLADVAIKRATIVRSYSGNDGAGDVFTQQPGDNYDVSQTALLVRLESQKVTKRSVWISGLPDSLTKTEKSQGIDAAFTNNAAFKAWSNYVKSGALRIRKVIGPGPIFTFNYSPIDNVVARMIRVHKRGRPFDLYRGRRM